MSQSASHPDPGRPQAPGGPGLKPTWTSSAKDAVTGALGGGRVRATVGHGVVNEVYWPSSGEPQVRDLTFIVRTDSGWHDVKRTGAYTLTPHPEAPIIEVCHTGEDFTLRLTVMPSAANDSLLIHHELSAGTLYALLAPHLDNSGEDNTAWAQDGMLYATRGHAALAFLASGGFSRTSVGFVGVSDGWQDFRAHGEMTWDYARAECGNVALMGEVRGRVGTLAVGFARHAAGAALHVRGALQREFAAEVALFRESWAVWNARLTLPAGSAPEMDRARLSAQVIRVHEGSDFSGAIIASLSVPFGQSRDDLGGYHLVWPRDMVEAATALLAAGQVNDAQRALNYLMAAQSPDGHWPQNIYPDGEPFWEGDQLDETAFVILLAAKLRDLGRLGVFREEALRWCVRRAAGYLARKGPVSQEDRWEENSGVSAYTLALLIAALVAAGPWLDEEERGVALALADDWNARLEDWCYVTGEDAPLAAKYGVDGYYLRIAPEAAGRPGAQDVTIANTGGLTVKAGTLVSLDFGYLVRLGLRRADDPRVLNTLRVVDGELRRETPSGPLYYRYPHDGYGDAADGGPFGGQGTGRLWPLLAGERGHLALLAGGSAQPFIGAMLRSSGPGGLFPEQVWDAAPVAGLEPGKPSGSAMPLVWAHAEFIKLLWAREHGVPYEVLADVRVRYGGDAPTPGPAFWRSSAPVHTVPAGRALILQDEQPFTLHFSFGAPGAWPAVQEREAQAGAFGLYHLTLTAAELTGHAGLNFTRRFGEAWEGRDHHVAFPVSGA